MEVSDTRPTHKHTHKKNIPSTPINRARAVTSYYQKQLYSYFNNMFKLAEMEASQLRITVPMWWEFNWDQLVPSQRASNAEDVATSRSQHAIHYIDVIMTTMASQITSLMVVYSTAYSDADQRKHQSSASLAFVWGIHRDRWIPRTKGQLRGKCFHLMTSSCGEDMPSILYVWVLINCPLTTKI